MHKAPFPQIDIIGAMVIVWRVRGTRTHQEMRERTSTFTQCARKLPEFPEIMQNNAITPFKVTDFATNQKLINDFLLVINTNLPPMLHRFQDIAILGYPSCV